MLTGLVLPLWDPVQEQGWSGSLGSGQNMWAWQPRSVGRGAGAEHLKEAILGKTRLPVAGCCLEFVEGAFLSEWQVLPEASFHL